MNEEPFGIGRVVGYLKEKNKLWVFILMLIIGLGLIFLSGTDNKSSSHVSEYKEISEELEKRVERLCGEIQGVDRVSAMVMIDTAQENKYAVNSQTDKDEGRISERYEYVSTSGGLLPIAEIAPKVRGVAVVCAGGGKADIQLKLTELLCALFDIPASAVSIAEGK